MESQNINANNKDNKDLAATELKVALDNRAFEIQLFWQRSNYFLVLMTALGVATFSIKDQLLSLIVSTLATWASFFWFRTNLGSKFWQESWEVEVVTLAKEQKIRSFERTTNEVINQVRESLHSEGSTDNRSFIRKWVDKKIVQKYSVTYNMILLSMVSTGVWSIVTIILFLRVINYYCSLKDGCLCCHFQ